MIGKLEWESELDSRSLTHCTFPQFQLQIDLEALMLLDEANLLEMKIEIGPRKKILKGPYTYNIGKIYGFVSPSPLPACIGY